MKKIISLFCAVIIDLIAFFKPTSKKGLFRLAILVVVIIAAIVFVTNSKTNLDSEETVTLPIVTTSRVDQVSSESTFSLLGTVAAVSEADLKAETTGRVTAVNVSLGQLVSVGTVIATFENSSQYASVLQAEGAYEAALAAAAQGSVGVASAENSVLSAQNSALANYNNAYAKLNTALYNSLDEIFADPDNTYRTPGFVPRDYAQKEGLVDTSFRSLDAQLTQQQSAAVTTDSVENALTTALNDTTAMLALINLLQNLISDNDIDEPQTATETTYLSTLANTRQDILGARSSVETALTNLTAAQKSLEQAKISGEAGTASAADAQVKQALGVLRAAQANYAKTIVRSPISGVINELSIKTGDFVSQQSRVALVANNDALEITAFVGERDRDQLTTGMEVTLEGGIVGTITAIAPAVDSVTKKFEVKISSESDELKNGDTVSIVVANSNAHDQAHAEVLVPITSIKFTNTDGEVFTVIDDVLVVNPVTLGEIRGAYVEVLEGLAHDQEIVIDARGLTAGRKVEVITK